MPRSHRSARTALAALVGALVTLGVGCTAADTTAGAAATDDGVHGTMLDISDVQSVPDAPRSGASVLVLPDADTAVLFDAVDELFVDAPDDLGRLGVVLAVDNLPASAGRATTDHAGRFAVDVADGPALLCVGETDGPQLRILGCQPIDVPVDVDVGFGEAGLTVE